MSLSFIWLVSLGAHSGQFLLFCINLSLIPPSPSPFSLLLPLPLPFSSFFRSPPLSPILPPFTPAGCWQEDAFAAEPHSAITFFACRYFVISSAFYHTVTLSDELVSGDWGREVREFWQFIYFYFWQFIFERGVKSVQRHKSMPTWTVDVSKSLIISGAGGFKVILRDARLRL